MNNNDIDGDDEEDEFSVDDANDTTHTNYKPIDSCHSISTFFLHPNGISRFENCFQLFFFSFLIIKKYYFNRKFHLNAPSKQKKKLHACQKTSNILFSAFKKICRRQNEN